MAKRLIARKGPGRGSEVYAVDTVPDSGQAGHDWEEVGGDGGSSTHVFEVEDLLISAGTDWSSDLHALGTLAIPAGAVRAEWFYIEYADPMPVGNEVDIGAVTDPHDALNTLYTGAGVNGDDESTVSRQVNQFAPVSGLAAGASTTPEPEVTWHIGLLTSGPTTADITIVRARAAILVL